MGQIVIDGDADLTRIALLQKGLYRVVGRYQSEIEALLGIVHPEEVARPGAGGPCAAPVTEPQIFQMIGMRALWVAGVIVEAAERVRVQARKPPLLSLVFDRGGQLIARRERLRAPVDAQALEDTADSHIACVQQRGAA